MSFESAMTPSQSNITALIAMIINLRQYFNANAAAGAKTASFFKYWGRPITIEFFLDGCERVQKTKKSKYKKVHLEAWKCGGCNFECAYKTLKCPLCSCLGMIKII